MEGRVWEGEGMRKGMGSSTGRNMWGGEWPKGHENKWKSANDGGGGHLQDVTKTWDKGGTQESMAVTLAVTHSIGDGDIESEEATACRQSGTPVE